VIDKIQISYIDEESNITKREISNWSLLNDFSIFAFCHLRNEKRTFKTASIIIITDLITGESTNDIASFFNVSDENKKQINMSSMLSYYLPLIKVLKCGHLKEKPNKNSKKYYIFILDILRQLTENYYYDENYVLDYISNKVFVHTDNYQKYIEKLPKEFKVLDFIVN